MRFNQQVLWNACAEAEDYFSRLGGSGTYPGFSEYHVPGLVLILAYEKVGPHVGQDGALRHLLPEQIWKETDGLPERVSKIVDRLLTAESDDLHEFAEYVSSVYEKKSADEAELWRLFVKNLEGLGWRI